MHLDAPDKSDCRSFTSHSVYFHIHPSAFTTPCTSSSTSFVAISVTVPSRSGFALCAPLSSWQRVSHKHADTHRTHLYCHKPLMWHCPGCQVCDTSRGTPVLMSLLIFLPSCLPGPWRCTIRLILTAWLIQRVQTIRGLQKFNKLKLCFTPWVSNSRGK